MKYFYPFLFLMIISASCTKNDDSGNDPDPDNSVDEPDEDPDDEESNTFTNPLRTKGADPWIIQDDGKYYYTYTQGSKVVLFQTDKVSELDEVNQVDVWIPPSGTMYSRNIWAPEIQKINDNWYIYFAADNGHNSNHRMYVLENTSSSPMRGNWELKGKVAASTDQWAIDGTVMEYDNKMYMLWSGGNAGAAPQHIYIAEMSNPWTIESERVRISSPEYGWEMNKSAVNEGPQALFNPDGELFVVYSGSHFLSDDYALGLLNLKEGGDPMNADDWEKKPTPVFTKNPDGGAFGPGHNGFFKSPDGTEDWIIYHARNLPDNGDTNYRNPRIQKFTWNPDGTPNFGVPVPIGEEIEVPSGE